MNKNISHTYMIILLLGLCFIISCSKPDRSVFSKDNITPWCIVPFDVKQRNPQERAEMLSRLGFKTLAYDWRNVHIPQFDEEIVQLKKHGITMTAFWWTGGLPENEEAFKASEIMNTQMDFFRRNSLKLDVWVAINPPDVPDGTDEERCTELARRLDILAGEFRKLDCRLGIYNHGGWGGEPDNMIRILKMMKSGNAGIVYNFHHAHEHLDLLPEAFNRMLPYLYCVNLNGMTREGPKILPLGEGKEDIKIMKMISSSGYNGPIGIIGHVNDEDVELVLKRNIEGLKKLLLEIGDKEALKTF